MKFPAVTIERDEAGKVESVYVRLREGKAKFSTQPNRDALVFFELGADRMPIGLTFLAPLKPGVAFTTIVDLLCNDGDSKPVGIDTQPQHHYFPVTDAEFRKIMQELSRSVKELEGAY